jgi:hypothetical protein
MNPSTTRLIPPARLRFAAPMGLRSLRSLRAFGLRILALAGLALVAACPEDPPAPPSPNDTGVTLVCDGVTLCPKGLVCISGVCEAEGTDAGGNDGGPQSGARLQVCTPEGCDEPLRMNFGGSRIGVATTQTLILRSIGEDPVEIRNIDILNQGTEFTVEPGGDLNTTLEPSMEMAIRVSHVAADGIADNETLQIISNAERARVLVQVFTEYKGVPSLFVGERADTNVGDVLSLDFGNVRAGRLESKTLYLKNKDRVIDGSILTIDEVRTDPLTSSNFRLQADTAMPAFLNQFNSLCADDQDCDAAAGDTCETAQSVCKTGAGPLRDVLSVTVDFVGTTPGMVEEQILVLSNDGGQGQDVRMITLRANVTYSEVDVTPDPIAFPEAFVGFPQRQAVTLSNLGTAPLVVSSITLAQGSTFAVDLGATALPLTLQAQSTATFDVVFTAPAVDTYADTLTIVSDDATNPMLAIAVSGVASIAPRLVLSNTVIDFGDTHIQIGASPSATRVVTAENQGGSELRVTSLRMAVGSAIGFTVDPSSLPPIPPGGQATFNVRYGPAAPSFPNVESGTVEVVTNDPTVQPVAPIALTGRGVNPNALLIPGNQINYNTLPANPNNPDIYYAQELVSSVTLLNSGLGPMTITSIAFSGDLRSAFLLENPPTLPLSIDQGMNQIIAVRYRPPSAGVDGASVVIQTNDLDQPGGVVTVSLIGSTSNCPVRTNATGLANAAGACTYACTGGWYDLNGDLNNGTSNGCEYACTFSSALDLPDDNFIDANCDGIDGNPANAVFVAPPPLGNDGNPGTMASPVARIATAIGIAAGTGRAVYVSNGTPYAEGPLTMVAGVSIHGGYSAQSAWVRNAFNTTTIVSSTGVGIVATSINTTTVIDRFEILPGNAPNPGGVGPGLNSIGIEVRSSSALQIRNSRIVAGNGSRGSDGTNGTTGLAGNAGGRGNDGCDGCSASGINNGAGGAGGSSPCGATGGTGGTGGYDNANGVAGGGTGGGGGGRGAEVCKGSALCTDGCGLGSLAGTGGSNGTTGGAGAHMAGGNGAGSVVLSVWQGSRGVTGDVGGPGVGGGGGGGGGGGADDCEWDYPFAGCGGAPGDCNADRAGGGGGGGGGGCGGSGGTGGYGGGASFGVYLYNSSVQLTNNTITAGAGGRGGDGGDYGSGGSGGDPGQYGAGRDDGANGAVGGRGGNGGRGGSGGGGGGGVSYCIYRWNSLGSSLIGNGCTQGVGGAGGLGGLLNSTGTGATGNAGAVF